MTGAAVMRWGAIVGVGGVGAALALWLRSLGVFSAGAAMIALRSSAVPFGEPPSLGAIGFDVPPLPVLLAMPMAAVPALRWEPLAAVAVSVAAAAVAAVWLNGALRAMGLGLAVAGVIALASALHPVWLYASASGSGSVLAAALLVAALRLQRRWQGTGDVLALIASSFAIALAGLARYDLFIGGWAIALLVARGPRVDPDGPRDERFAFGVAYAAAVTGALGLWVVTTGAFTGDVLAFIAGSNAVQAAPPSAQPPLHALLIMIPALATAAVAALMRRGTAAATVVLAVSASTLGASIVSVSPLSLDAVVPLIPVTALLVGEIVAARAALRPLLALALPALVGSGALSLSMSSDWGEGHRVTVDAIAGRARPMWTGERDLAAHVRASGGRIVVDDRTDGVVALLLSDARAGAGLARVRILTVESTPARSGRAVGAPDADLVLVRTPTGRGSAHRVASVWPTLYGGGAPWARLAGSWPVSGEPAEYRLYAVRAVSLR